MTIASKMAFTLGRSGITDETCLEIVEILGSARYDEVFDEYRKNLNLSDDAAVNAQQQIIRTLSHLAKHGRLDDSETQTYIDSEGRRKTRSKYKVPPKRLPYRPSKTEILTSQLEVALREVQVMKAKYEAAFRTIETLEGMIAKPPTTND